MDLTIKDLMLVGAHFGHRTAFRHPDMTPYIYGVFQKTNIINLDYTIAHLQQAGDFFESLGSQNKKILLVCTKPYAIEIIENAGKSSNMPYINQRWLGGLLTNFDTIRSSVSRLIKMEEDIRSGTLRKITKKEGIRFISAKDKLERSVGGLRAMDSLPDALCVIDAGYHAGAIREANMIGIPVIGFVDTNHSPKGIDFVVPANDDSKEASELYLRYLVHRLMTGQQSITTK